jgi:hypothetical protein
MPCYTNYIELDNLVPSRTGLYLDSLPGIDVVMIDGLRKSGNDSDTTWEVLYKRAWDNLVSDVTKALNDKFYVDTKIVSRETSSFKDDYNSSGNAGVKLTLTLSRYSKIHVISVGLWSQSSHTDAVINFYDTDADGELLLTLTEDLVAGRNTLNVDYEFEVNTLYVVIDTTDYPVRQTENKSYYGVSFITTYICSWDWYGGLGSVEQINNGGLNLKYNIYCSIDKFVCENINLFKMAFLYRNALEITHERRYGERLNEFTTMTIERADELNEYFNARYEKELLNAVKSQNIKEDFVCFNCKNTVSTKTSLP